MIVDDLCNIVLQNGLLHWLKMFLIETNL